MSPSVLKEVEVILKALLVRVVDLTLFILLLIFWRIHPFNCYIFIKFVSLNCLKMNQPGDAREARDLLSSRWLSRRRLLS